MISSVVTELDSSCPVLRQGASGSGGGNAYAAGCRAKPAAGPPPGPRMPAGTDSSPLLAMAHVTCLLSSVDSYRVPSRSKSLNLLLDDLFDLNAGREAQHPIKPSAEALPDVSDSIRLPCLDLDRDLLTILSREEIGCLAVADWVFFLNGIAYVTESAGNLFFPVLMLHASLCARCHACSHEAEQNPSTVSSSA